MKTNYVLKSNKFSDEFILLRCALVFASIHVNISDSHYSLLISKLKESENIDYSNNNVYKMFLYSFLHSLVGEDLFDYIYENIFSEANNYELRNFLVLITIDMLILKYYKKYTGI